MYRKFTADNIFTGHEILPENFVLITDEKGIVKDIIEKQEAGDDIEIFKGLLCPGFINAHCHLELSHMKNTIPTGTGLVKFVQQVMTSRTATMEAKLEAMQQAADEMYNNGIVAVGDICNTTDSISVKAKSKLHWHNFIEISGFADAAAAKRFDEMKKVFDAFENQKSFAPHAPYSVSKKLFELINAATANQLISIHNQECAAEDELYQHKSGDFLNLYKNFGIDISSFQPTGKSSLQSFLPYFTHNQSVLLVHNTFTSQADMSVVNDEWSMVNGQSAFNNIQRPISNTALFFCLCPNANQYIENKMPPVQLLQKNHCNIVLGTDSYASNWQLNILEEIKTIQKEIPQAASLQELLQWGTINGAKALQMENELGSFDKGKKPGIVLIDAISMLHLSPTAKSRRIM